MASVPPGQRSPYGINQKEGYGGYKRDPACGKELPASLILLGVAQIAVAAVSAYQH